MNQQQGSTVNVPARKSISKKLFTPAALALAAGLVLELCGAAALAASNPIPGVDVIVKKKPGGIPVHAKTDARGAYQFNRLAPGEYELIIPGKANQSLTVGSDGKVSGQLKDTGGGTPQTPGIQTHQDESLGMASRAGGTPQNVGAAPKGVDGTRIR